MDKTMEKKKGHLNYIIFLLGLVCVTFFVLLKDQNLETLYNIIKNLRPTMLVLGLLSAFAFICCEALVLQTLLAILGDKPSFFQTLKYSIVGFYFSSITPSASGGQPMQVYYMKKDNINISHSSLAILVTVIIYEIMMVSYALLSLLFNFTFIKDKMYPIHLLLVFGFALNIILICIMFIAIFSDKLIFKIADFFIKILNKLKIVKDVEKMKEHIIKEVKEYKNGAGLIRQNFKAISKVFLITFIQLTATYSITFFVYKAFGLNEISFWRIIALQSILNISVSFIPLPGAVGASEGAFMLVFKNLFPIKLLTSAMLVTRGISFYTLLFISSIFIIGIHIFGENGMETF